MLTSAFSFVNFNPASLSAFSSLFLSVPWVLLNPFNMEFLSYLLTCHHHMQSESRTCINCSIVLLVVASNSWHRFTADIISTLLFKDALSCFKGGSSSIQVAVYVLKSQLFGNVFSNLTVGPLYLFACLTSCCSENAFFNPCWWTPSIQHSIQ